MPNANATSTTPISIFTGVDGSALRRCSQIHSADEHRREQDHAERLEDLETFSGAIVVSVLSRAQNVNV